MIYLLTLLVLLTAYYSNIMVFRYTQYIQRKKGIQKNVQESIRNCSYKSTFFNSAGVTFNWSTPGKPRVSSRQLGSMAYIFFSILAALLNTLIVCRRNGMPVLHFKIGREHFLGRHIERCYYR